MTQKQKILIVDDSEMNRSILVDMLGDEYEIYEAEDGAEAIATLHKHVLDISLVLLDVVMPHMDGFEVLSVMNQRHWIENIPVIMISAESASSQVERAYELGVTDFIARPFDALIVRRRVINTLLLYTKQKKLIGMLADQIQEKQRVSSMMVDILSHIVEFRNGESGQHIIRVRTLTEVLLRQLQRKTDRYPLTQTEISLICTASALHDVGKIAIDGAILNKPGRLTPEEFEVIKTHSLIGAEMLRKLPAYDTEPLIRTAYEICRWHHERYDGRGYPDGLVGDEIPISAQIVAMADVYDALTSDRCYKKAIPHETALEMIQGGQCGTFNPLLLECLREVAPSLEADLTELTTRQPQTKPRLLAQDLVPREDPISSERSLRLLEHERMKYNFFAEMSDEIQFEYTVEPDMMTISGWGAKRFGLDEVIMNPSKHEKIGKLFGGKLWKELSAAMRSTVPEHPVITREVMLHCNGQPRWYRIVARAMWSADDPPVYMGAIGKFVDVHESRMKLEKLERQVSHDMLTGLLNHSSARELIRSKIDHNPNSSYILAILDLDKFKEANDNHGHIFGDQLLKHFAEKLRQSVRSGDIVARVGGDEFLLFLQYNTDAVPVIDRIYRSISGQYGGFPISVSMGAARTVMVGMDYETLFHAADQALYAAKQAGRGQYRFYDDSMRGTLSTISPIDRNAKGECNQ